MAIVTRHLVLLPGLDGTGRLFDSFLAALPNTFTATAVAYPADKFLSYAELLPFVRLSVPKDDSFVVLAESFSTPVAVEYAASNPRNLAALVIVAGFLHNPIGGWSIAAKVIAKPWFFKLRVPRWVLERTLIGREAPNALVQKFRQVLQLVSPAVLSGRVCETLTCDVTHHLARIKVPLMYVQATQDRLLSNSCVTEIKRIRPDISIVLVDGPHLLLQREPRAVAAVVSTFIRELVT
jgi:pimeloyl-ACP methyl ester carboxylesterase